MGLASSARYNSAATNGGYHLRSVAYCEITPSGAVWLKDEYGHVLDCVRKEYAATASTKRKRCIYCPKET